MSLQSHLMNLMHTCWMFLALVFELWVNSRDLWWIFKCSGHYMSFSWVDSVIPLDDEGKELLTLSDWSLKTASIRLELWLWLLLLTQNLQRVSTREGAFSKLGFCLQPRACFVKPVWCYWSPKQWVAFFLQPLRCLMTLKVTNGLEVIKVWRIMHS